MSMLTTAVQRVRLTFAVRWPLQYASVLDMGRLWERLLRRTGVPMAYTQGYNPHMRMQFADALPVGYTSDCEAVDIYLGERVAPDALPAFLQRDAPPGLRVTDAIEVSLKAQAPQALMQAAIYLVSVHTDATPAAIREALAALLERESITRVHKRRGRARTYDLRELIYELAYLSGVPPRHHLQMRLRCGSHGSGRPADVLAAAELPVSDLRVHRTHLIWAEQEEHPS
ncbi:MAG: TIGR03936 family radical SAM-associated protein [Anaerolineae bacterium]